MMIDCLRMDFGLDPETNLPIYSLAITGTSRSQVIKRRAAFLANHGLPIGAQTLIKEQWMSQEPDDDVCKRDGQEMEE